MLTHPLDLRTGTPVWMLRPAANVPTAPLTRDCAADIVIIGAGITGAMAAEELASAGKRVILLERRGPLLGSTAASTALLQYDIDRPLTLLRKQIGQERAVRAWRRSKLALESLAAKIQALDIRCGMKRTDSLYLAGNLLGSKALHEEWHARNRAGFHTQWLSRSELGERYGIERSAAIRAFDNLTVHPIKLAAGFLRRAIEAGAIIYCPATAASVTHETDGVAVHTSEGPTIRAKALIYASGYEVPGCLKSRRRDILSTFAIATRPQPDKLWPTRCLIWESSDPYLYVRTTRDGRVICGGEDEGFADPQKRDALLKNKQATLEKKLAKLFPQLDARAEYGWSAAFGSSKTGLPSIGAVPGQPHTYAILAYGGNGITFSRLGAELIRAELVDGKKDGDADLFAFA